MSRTYIFYYDYKNTSGNHAGMAYLLRYLNRNIDNIKLIRNIPQEYTAGRHIARVYAVLLAFYMRLVICRTDKLFFFEYVNGDIAHHDLTAKLLRYMKVQNTFLAMVHLSGNHLLQIYRKEEIILKKLRWVDRIYVLGSSLKTFIENLGYKGEVIKTYHYVDTNFYKPATIRNNTSELQVIFVGSLKRDFDQLRQIIEKSPKRITFHLCLGLKKEQFKNAFSKYSNVKMYGFLQEQELLQIMQMCDVNLSVLEDTVGSNAITTALAVGLIQVVSDVGSIRDYCNEDNSFFCNNVDDYVNAFQTLSNDKSLVSKMKENAYQSAQNISKQNFLKDFRRFVSDN